MTLKQWLKHLSQWWYSVLSFPFPWKDPEELHFYTGLVNSGDYECLTCGHYYYDPKEIVYRCPICSAPIIFQTGNRWVCSSEYCDAEGDAREIRDAKTGGQAGKSEA